MHTLFGISLILYMLKLSAGQGFLYCDLRLCEKDRLLQGQYHIVFSNPELIISTKFGRDLILSETYKTRDVSIVIDEAYCIFDW